MIDIVEKIFRDCTTMFTNYFKDAKIGIKRKDQCSGVNYYIYLKEKKKIVNF
ncbi:hypothetical protein DDB_G0293810 [Dictyostelium discoideum AX4]|uniref:Uncharacterized protein n=1 Tax=Dictyostelium discoideum TaxID=44689 RepID=Q54B94_DICDI|nr:hypothetical protein DDB_G0293810 [Dictyostelium discoideum AX4]EAL60538.2 hypothetical protein DDB_G0293810 [Dictyostelium discoideum AX4]|eukprot:XP_628956.2 hypothetical protein DDB_G0293810 [Dictyostelium discoideum AX4]